MATDIELAVLSSEAYQSTRHPDNRIFEPVGWTPLDARDGLAARLAAMGFSGNPWNVTARNGFEAVAYQKGADVVIAFAGWAPFGTSLGDVAAGAALTLGWYSDQLRDAARYYAAIKEAMPGGAQFTFTGHSLRDVLAVDFDHVQFKTAALADHNAKIASDLVKVGLGPDSDLAGCIVRDYKSGQLAFHGGTTHAR